MEAPRIYLLAQFDEASNQKLAAVYGELAKAGLHGEQTKDIPYHFTLGSFPLERRDEVLQRAQDVARAAGAFDIGLSHIGLFGQRVLFIAPSMNAELLKLHSALIPEETVSGAHNWVAHATVLIDSAENIAAAIPITAQSFSPFTARIESVTAYEFFPKKFLGEYRLGF